MLTFSLFPIRFIRHCTRARSPTFALYAARPSGCEPITSNTGRFTCEPRTLISRKLMQKRRVKVKLLWKNKSQKRKKKKMRKEVVKKKVIPGLWKKSSLIITISFRLL